MYYIYGVSGGSLLSDAHDNFAEYEETVETLLNANADPNITENVSNERKVVAKLFCYY